MQGIVRAATRSDIPELARVLGLAFADDPIIGWLIPGAETRAERAAVMFATMVRRQFLALGAVDVVVDDAGAIAGAAVWAPSGGDSTPSALAQLRMMPGLFRAFRGKLQVAARLAEGMARHHPTEPHWYLAFIGTLPAARGRGFGQALLSERLTHCDEVGAASYLESSKPENVPYYERFGYRADGELDLTGGGPPMWPMWRDPR